MLGNLVDNACKWARTRVEVRSVVDGGRVVTTVDDDGPGLDPSLRETVLQRGVRADEAAPGSGLGLAIVADLVELYGGSIALGSSPLGGLRATLGLPAAYDAASLWPARRAHRPILWLPCDAGRSLLLRLHFNLRRDVRGAAHGVVHGDHGALRGRQTAAPLSAPVISV